MEVLLLIIHILAALLLVGAVLLQSGKGGGLGAGFGGASASATQLFGGRGATGFLTRATVALAATFMFTSLALAYLSSRPNSALDLSETSGAVSPQEDEIIEEGSGPMPAAPAEVAPEAAAPQLDLEAVEPVEVEATEPVEAVEVEAVEPVEAEAVEPVEPAEAPVAE